MSTRVRALLVVVAVVALGAIVLAIVSRGRSASASGARRQLLVFEVPSSVEERGPSGSLWSLGALRKPQPTFHEWTAAVRHAAHDHDVAGLVLHVGDVEWGWARLDEMRSALAEFRASG